MGSIKVLLVEDDLDYRQAVSRFLEKCNICVESVETAEKMYEILDAFAPDVLILDINLPGDNGFEALQKVRPNFAGNIIILSTRKEVDDKISGLSKGADYYIPKPVDMRELEAVIASFVNKAKSHEKPVATWVLDTAIMKLTTPCGQTVNLSGAEFNILHHLSNNSGIPSSRDDLFNTLGKVDPRPEDRSLDVLISRLRGKFSLINVPLPIKSIRNEGYIFSNNIKRVA